MTGNIEYRVNRFREALFRSTTEYMDFIGMELPTVTTLDENTILTNPDIIRVQIRNRFTFDPHFNAYFYYISTHIDGKLYDWCMSTDKDIVEAEELNQNIITRLIECRAAAISKVIFQKPEKKELEKTHFVSW